MPGSVLTHRLCADILIRILITQILRLSISVWILIPDDSAGATLPHLNHGLGLCRVKSSQTEQLIETW